LDGGPAFGRAAFLFLSDERGEHARPGDRVRAGGTVKDLPGAIEYAVFKEFIEPFVI